MPWYLRKSFGSGPFRVNLSKRGIGASVGIKGLRFGIGPRGSYLAGGRGGLYFRQYLGTQPRTQHRVPSYDQEPAGRRFAESGETFTVEQVGPALPGDEIASQINERLRKPRFSLALFTTAAISLLWLAANNHGLLAIFAFGALAAWGLVLHSQEAALRRIEFAYDLEDPVVQIHERMVDAFCAAAESSRIWRVQTRKASRDPKYTAGADTLVDRVLTKLVLNDRTIQSNAQVPWIPLSSGKLCLLPERMLHFSGNRVMALDYASLQVASRMTAFREHEAVPRDGEVIDHTWQYVNKSGAPDRRFSNNRQIPILRYSDFLFQHPSLTFNLQFSRSGAAETLCVPLKNLSRPRVQDSLVPKLEPRDNS